MSNTCPVVVQLFFGGDDKPRSVREPDVSDFVTDPDCTTFFALPLWKPHGKPIYRWSIDLVTCRDERWVVVGPFATVADAERAVRAQPERLRGYRIVNAH